MDIQIQQEHTCHLMQVLVSSNMLVLGLSLLLLSGCGSGRSSLGMSSVQGVVLNGQQPITGANVQLYAAGSEGIASSAQPLLAKAGVSDSRGHFTLSELYTCPTPNSKIYLVAEGGNPGLSSGSDNASISLMAMLGACDELAKSAFVTVNEVTTVGSVAPVSSFMNSVAQLGANASDDSFPLAVKRVAMLIDPKSGLSPGTDAPDNTMVPTDKLNTLADVLAACVSSAGGKAGDGSVCGALFALATPPQGVAPTNTATAVLRIAQNPTINVAELFALNQPATAPFQPTLSTAPHDWAMSLVTTPVKPAFSPAPGTYAAGQTITIATTTPSSAIHYTVDGSTPTATSPSYAGPLVLSKTETIRAIAISPSASSTAASATYTTTPAHLIFTIQPVNGTAGATMAAVPTVQIVDASGRGLQNSATISLSLGTNPGSATLKGAATIAAVNGIASFPGLSVSAPGVGYTLSATSASITAAASTAFSVATLANTTGTSYYVANAGNDLNDGKSVNKPWRTVAKVNDMLARGLIHWGDSILLNGGDVFRDDYLKLENKVVATDATTLATNPPVASGIVGHPLTIGSYGTGKAVIDGADPVDVKWTLVHGTTYQATVATMPSKLFVDCPVRDCPQLLPVPNAVGQWSPSVAYRFLDAVTYNPGSTTGFYISGMPRVMALNQHPGQYGNTWVGITNPATLSNEGTVAGTQTFSPTNSGLQNVEAIGNGSVRTVIGGGKGYASSTPFTSQGGGTKCVVAGAINAVSGVPTSVTYTTNTGCTSIPTLTLINPLGSGVVIQLSVNPGSWYIAGSAGAYTIYVNLADGSNPNMHTFEGTSRPYGVEMASVNYVTVENLAIEHTEKSAILAYAYTKSTLGGAYYTNEYNVFTNNSVWNYGDIIGGDLTIQQVYFNLAEGGITVFADGAVGPHLLRGIALSHNSIGTMDSYFGIRGQLTAGIFLSGIDGGGTANNPIASHDTISTTNSAGIQYGGIFLHGTNNHNQGGAIAYETLTNNQGNIFFGGTIGGRIHHNLITNSFGEGIQLGGGSVSTVAVPQVIDHNVIANLGQSASTVLFNAIDCNGVDSGVFEINNTMYNTNSAGPTFENGCDASHFHNNLVDQLANNYQPGTAADGRPNTSYTVYFVSGSNTGTDWSNNLWTPGVNSGIAFYSSSLRFGCAGLSTGMPDLNSACVASPLFTNPSYLVNDFSLRAGSPAIGFGVGASSSAPFATRDAGAIPYGQKTLF